MNNGLTKLNEIPARISPLPIRAMTPERMKNLNYRFIKPNISQIIKSKPTTLASHNKRIYPLNIQFDSYTTKNELRKSKGPILKEIPNFLNDFIENSSKVRYEVKSQLFLPNERSYSPSRCHKNDKRRSITTGVSNKRQSIKSKNDEEYFHTLEDERLFDEENRYFKPNVIYINPKSKITLYSPSPLCQIIRNKKIPKVLHHRSITPTSFSTIKDRSENNLPVLKSYEVEKFAIDKPAMTFGEKLIRIKCLVIDPVINQAD